MNDISHITVTIVPLEICNEIQLSPAVALGLQA